MAERLFTNVRLGLKVDTLQNWKDSSLVLKKGEVAFATVAASEGTGLTDPVCMMKIGDGEHTFSELNFDFYAKASDVVTAAKSEASLTAFIQTVLAGEGIASDEVVSALSGRVDTAEGEIDTLQSEMDAVEAKAAANETAISGVKGLVGDKAVATQISEAIAALNLADTYEVKGEAAKVSTALETYKTSNDAAVKKVSDDLAGEIARAKAAEEANAGAISGIKDGTTIDSFADVEAALAGKQATGDYATKADAQGYANAKDADIAAAKKAGEDAAAAVDEKLTAEVERATKAEAQALTDAKAYTDAEITEWVGDKTVGVQISTAIANEKLAETYAPIVHKHVKADITDFAHTHEMGEVNGLVDALAGKETAGAAADALEAAIEYADGKDEAIEAAQAAADKAQEEVDALETLVGTIPAGATATDVIGYVQEKTAGIATEGAMTELGNRVGAIEADYLKTADKTALQGEIDALELLVGDKAVATQISEAVAAEAKLRSDADTALGNRVKAIEDDYLKGADKTELVGAIATAKTEAIEAVLGEAVPADFDTLKEVAAWIQADTTASAELVTRVSDIEKDYLKAADKTELEGKITAAQNAADNAQDEVDALEEVVATKAAASDVTTLTGRVTTAEGKITTLEGEMDVVEGKVGALETKVGDKTVAEQIQSAITAENLGQYALASDLDTAEGKIEALEGKAHEHANATELAKFVDGDKAKLDTAVQTVSAASGLKATKTGTEVAIDFDEEVVFVFDCGSSAE